MKINRIHIISFGGLKNYTLELSDGFNCIYGQNEQGKTTVMSFIKMMFYGSERGSSQISKNIRKKYTPWDGSPMAGSIEFESDGKSYKLEREFRSSNSTDKVTLTDLSLGEKQTVEGNIGVRLFGLSSAAFDRSIFIGQSGFPENDPNAEGELNARLSNMASTGEEQISLEEISSRIEKARFSLISKSGKAGEYYKNTLLAEELKQKLDQSVYANLRYLEGKEKLISYANETAKLVKKADTLKSRLSREQDIKNAEKLEELLLTKEKLEEVKAHLTLSDGTPADENYLRNLKFVKSKLQNASFKAEAKEKEAEIIKNQLDTLVDGPKLSTDETPEKLSEDLISLDKNLASLQEKAKETNDKIRELTDKKSNQGATLNPTLLIIDISLFAVSGVMLLVSKIAAISFFAAAVIMTVLSFVLKSDKKAKIMGEEIAALENIFNSQSSHIEELKAQIGDKKTKLEAIKLAASSNIQVIEKQKAELSAALEQLSALRDEENSINMELDNLINRINTADGNKENILNILESAVSRQKELKQHIGFLLKDLNNISYEDAKKKLETIKAVGNDEKVDFTKLSADYESLSKEISNRKETEATAAAELKAMLNGVENTDVLKSQLKEKNDLLTAQKEFCDSADIALRVLTESFAELRQSYGSQLEKKAAEIFARLTDGKYSGMTVSKSFSINVSLRENPISREAEYLSSGTFDQAYLSLRLALSSVLGEDLPLFLDDTLTQYDDIRAQATLRFLKDYSKAGQLVMFTCHKSIFDSAQNLDCTVTKL